MKQAFCTGVNENGENYVLDTKEELIKTFIWSNFHEYFITKVCLDLYDSIIEICLFDRMNTFLEAAATEIIFLQNSGRHFYRM